MLIHYSELRFLTAFRLAWPALGRILAELVRVGSAARRARFDGLFGHLRRLEALQRTALIFEVGEG